MVASGDLGAIWSEIDAIALAKPGAFGEWVFSKTIATNSMNPLTKSDFSNKRGQIDEIFSLGSVGEILARLESSPDPWCAAVANTLRERSPLMLAVTLEQIRRARQMSLADALRMERDMVRHSFHPRHLGRSGASTETVEGIRALAVDKDHQPRWSPARVEDVSADMVEPFFDSPWPVSAHPLRGLR